MGDKSSFEASNRSLRNISGIIRPQYRRHTDSDSEDTENTSEEDEEEDDAEGEDDDTYNKQQQSKSHSAVDNNDKSTLGTETVDNNGMDRLSKKFDQLLGFLTAGLRSVARAGVYSEMIEILAERLEMGAIAGGMKSNECKWSNEY